MVLHDRHDIAGPVLGGCGESPAQGVLGRYLLNVMSAVNGRCYGHLMVNVIVSIRSLRIVWCCYSANAPQRRVPVPGQLAVRVPDARYLAGGRELVVGLRPTRRPPRGTSRLTLVEF